MNDGIKQVAKYLREASRKSDFALDRTFEPDKSIERIRDVFDSTDSMVAKIKVPENVGNVSIDLNFGRKLPSLDCCGDCMCGITESYTSDSLVNGSIYVTTPYVDFSTTVYLDGIRATRNADYIEADSSTGQVAILIPASTIVISYVYTVGNCTDSTCVSNLPCLEFNYFSGLATVFADRFDRSRFIGPTGGCGGYIIQNTYVPNNAGAAPTITRIPTTININGEGEASLITNTGWILLGGQGKLVGTDIEIVVAGVHEGAFGDFAVALDNGYFSCSASIQFSSATSAVFNLGGVWEGIDNAGVGLDNYAVFNFSKTETHAIDFEGPYFIRVVQAFDGWKVKFWSQEAEEPSGFNMTLGLSDISEAAKAGTRDHTLIVPTISHLRVVADKIQAIKVGAGLNTGRWGYGNGTTSAIALGGYNATVCYTNPDGLIRFQFCETYSQGATAANNGEPSHVVSISYPSFVDDGDGLGRIISMTQRMVAYKIAPGFPRGSLRITGEINASWVSSDDPAVNVEFKSYPTGTTAPSQPTLFSGTTISSQTLQLNQWAPFEVFLPLESDVSGNVRWGIEMINPHQWAAGNPFHAGGFLFPNNHGLNISTRNVRVFANQSVDCTAQDYCDNCDRQRCPKVVDIFNTSSKSAPLAFTEFEHAVEQGLPAHLELGQGAEFNIASNVGTFAFTADVFASLYYVSPFDCQLDETTPAVQATLDFKINSSFIAGDVEFGGFDAGPELGFFSQEDGSGVGWYSFGLSDSQVATLPNLIDDTWYTLKWQVPNEENRTLIKVWQSGTSEPDWQVNVSSALVDSFSNSWGIEVNADIGWEVSVRNLIIEEV